MSFPEFIKEAAERADWSKVLVLSETMVRLPFDSDEGAVNVFIRPCGQLEGKIVLEFGSAVFHIPEDPRARLGLFEALLERNGNLMQGYWAIEETDGGKKLSVMAAQIAETMDFSEAPNAVLAVAKECSCAACFKED